VAPRTDTGLSEFVVEPVLDPDGAAIPLPTARFAPYTEKGAFLPLHRPQVNANTRMAAPFALHVTVRELLPDGAELSLTPEAALQQLEVRLLEGVMGRLAYALGAEKQRLRRLMHEVTAMRRASLARDNALDRLGADLAVPRFSEDLLFRGGVLTTESRREPDPEYRRRLLLHKPFIMPSGPSVSVLLNGRGTDSDSNSGALGEMGFTTRFRLLEDDNQFALAFHLVESGGGSRRQNFLRFIRDAYLVEPNVDVPDDRLLPNERRRRENELRARLRQRFSFPAGATIAPMLAAALDRVGRCREALGSLTPWPVSRAQDDAGGSRYELGLGVDLAPLQAQTLNAMVRRLEDPGRRPTEDQEIEALLQSMTPGLAADDREGRWLLEACGLKTLHRVDNRRIYVSHFATFGLAITGASNVLDSGRLPLEAHYHAPGDPGKHVILVEGLSRAAADWAARGGPAWTVLNDTQAAQAWERVTPRPQSDPALQVFLASGLPAVSEPADVVQRLTQAPVELLDTVRLAPEEAQRILEGAPEAIAELQALRSTLAANQIISALPLVTNTDEVLLVVAVVGLPEAGLNLGAVRSTGFRWYVVPIDGSHGSLRAVGSRTEYSATGSGLAAVVALGYARRGLTDPYEYRVELPQDAVLNLTQYEFLMNILERCFPLGVQVNTFSIRRQHVDLDGDGSPDSLDPAAARTYRPFRRVRHRGEAAVSLEQDL
jgi:hypothetical protein